MAILNQVLILFFMAGVGFFLTYFGKWKDSAISAFTSLVILVANPCLNFSKLVRMEPGSLTRDWAAVLVFSLALLCALLYLGVGIFRKSPRDERAVYAQMVAMSNAGFMGYPVMEAALGAEAVGYGVAFVTAFNLVSWSLALALFCRDAREGLRKMVNPAMMAILLGLFLQIAGLRLPALLADTVETLGGLATPLSMLVAGAYLTKVTKELFKNPRFLFACALRLILVPAATAGILWVCGLRGNMAGAIFVALCMPCANNMLMQASAYSTERASQLAVGGVAVTTALSAATIPLMTLLLRFF